MWLCGKRERERERGEREFTLKERCTEPYQKLTVLMDVFKYMRGVKGTASREMGSVYIMHMEWISCLTVVLHGVTLFWSCNLHLVLTALCVNPKTNLFGGSRIWIILDIPKYSFTFWVLNVQAFRYKWYIYRKPIIFIIMVNGWQL